MKLLCLDTEVSTHNKGNPFDSRNKFVCWSWTCSSGESDAERDLANCQVMVDNSDLIIGFHFKFDYHWLTNNGVDLSQCNIWDVQIAEFILSHFTRRFPSLNDTCLRYGIETKKDVVKTEYWDKGIQTEDIPWHILKEYAAHDAKITLECYHAQIKHMSKKQILLCQLMCMDMHVLREMEFNGVPYNEQLCAQRATEVDARITEIKGKLAAHYPSVPINFSSVDHLSAFLYGGVVVEKAKELIGFYKTGDRAGQPKYKNIEIEHQLPRLYQPLPGSSLKKEGLFATDEATLRKLKGKKQAVELLLELSKLEKLNGTYYRGLVELRKSMYWPEGLLHGQFNQCMARTGRLSSNKPNLQNFASELQDIFISKYND